MSIRIIQGGLGILYYAICDECKTESKYALTDGVAYKEGAVNVAYPNGWTHQNERVMGRAWKHIQRDYCPQCSVRPECRK